MINKRLYISDCDFKITEISNLMAIPLRTLKYHMKKHGIRRRNFTELTDDELKDCIAQILRNDPGLGICICKYVVC